MRHYPLDSPERRRQTLSTLRRRTLALVLRYGAVYHPGLPPAWPVGTPLRAIAAAEGYADLAVLAWRLGELDTDLEGTGRFIDALRIPYMGPSLGGVESIVEQPALMSHFTLNEAERAAIGISAELVRYAVGVEDAEDLIADLKQALDVALPARQSAR